ncbi:TPA: hypothetical protein ACX6RS_003379 [Photobacterium damselae]
MNECSIQKIIRVTKALNDFWLNCQGWAPGAAYELIKEARLDRQLSFAKTLPDYEVIFNEDVAEAKTIIGYATLRGMSESAIKLFLSAYIEDYLKDPLVKGHNNKVIKPKNIGFDSLISLYVKHGDSSFEDYLKRIQFRGNAIHHFNDREIGNQKELIEDIKMFKNFLLAVNSQLPYPDGYLNPEYA